MERETGIEPATNSLEGCDSTTELLPPAFTAIPAYCCCDSFCALILSAFQCRMVLPAKNASNAKVKPRMLTWPLPTATELLSITSQTRSARTA
jgi:hypothetical protein